MGVGTITLVKSIKDIQFGGQISRSFYDTKIGKWMHETSTDYGPLTKDMIQISMSNNIISHTSGRGSHGETSIDIITNRDRDFVLILSKPYVKRIRRNMLSDIHEKQICLNYLRRIKADVEGWTPVKLYSDLFKETDKILESFQ
ncbi:hypothetical protein A2716_03160 [candidate division WWE3 bacterium RIFCSPHIGHO2_01_FULL_40_23]|uniref:Uncharacterized protein n=1 Tax=candidate division WWE3 bacterium RIFCSPLOWO2_01_FULL_41_18 TaxID=1802625 RepID=A0A1F4VDW4_UNCKA|nr:MAG: hypothetical protein A2716_03160 [candidate division WWE3 bacterium RIFCSPHIGHO2_01_FULL_40_23]OGC54883.1 MAG: hypothetical protein A3A78_02770 [candidate division WWE3 bacterium RIFCSPLOWO2_01_FULL_41_18]